MAPGEQLGAFHLAGKILSLLLDMLNAGAYCDMLLET